MAPRILATSLVVLALAAVVSVAPCAADEVVFTDGTRQPDCKVTEETYGVVAYTLSVGAGDGVRQQRPAREVREVIYEKTPAALGRGLSLLGRGELEAALEAFVEAQSAGAARHRQHAFARAARLQLSLGDLAGARATWDALLAALPTTRFVVEARLGVVRCLTLAGDLPAAKKALATAEAELRGLALLEEASLPLELERARLHAAGGDAKAAVEAYRRLVSGSSARPAIQAEARVGLAEALSASGERARALTELRTVVARADDLEEGLASRAWMALGDCQRDGGASREAALSYLRVAVLDRSPRAARACFEAARLVEKEPALGGAERARALRDELTARWPTSEWATR
jgi:thioredoxin-like negative regulator of GroEL